MISLARPLLFLLFPLSVALGQIDQNSMPISAPVTIDTPGKLGQVAAQSVMRVVCTKSGMGGTGFFHSSGWVITAAHVVSDCAKNDLVIVLSDGQKIQVGSVIADPNVDLAALKPSKRLVLPSLPLSSKVELPIGTQVATWGFPSGYNSLTPLLTVGYLSGVDRLPTQTGFSAPRWVVNAAFNGGNSGGPVLDITTGEVIGVVSSKLAPIPPIIESAMDALAKQTSGFMYTQTNADGSTQQVSEGHLIGAVLNYLRSQTQLVLGHAVTSTDVTSFLKSHSITQ